jgi:hypothetical protein
MLYGAASVEAKSITIGSLFEERYPFAVPRYQRAYAWNDEAVSYFIRDIEAMLDKPAGQTSHFFGGVVCIELTDNQKVRPLRYELVDGQQRLATFMLALSCVVEMAQELENLSSEVDATATNQASTLRSDTTDKYITWQDADVAAGVIETRPRLTLSNADNDVFQELVTPSISEPNVTRESHRLLVEAKAALIEMTRRVTGDNSSLSARVKNLFRLRQALVQDAHLIHIVSKERNQAYRLFSVLNHRGESLSDADLLRSRSLELLESFPVEHEIVAKLWDEMLGHPAKKVEEFFRALYPSLTGERVKGEIFEATERKFFLPTKEDAINQATTVVEAVQMFRDELTVFAKISDGIWPYDRPPGVPNKVRAWQVHRLHRLIVTLKHELALPLLLAGARSLPEEDFAQLVYMLEIFAFRYKIICNGRLSRPTNVYYKQAVAMRLAYESYQLGNLRAQLRDLISAHASNGLFKQYLAENLRYSNTGQRTNIREFLTIIEDHRQWWLKTGSKNSNSNPKPAMTKVIDIDDVTLEHIYPQNATEADKNPTLEPIKHFLGNLTFFGSDDNVAAGNKSFSAKKEDNYKTSSILMTVELASNPSWTARSIRNREKELIDQAVRIFTI